MTLTLALPGDWPDPTPPITGEDRADLSAGQRLTLRQRDLIDHGRHPLTKGALHPDAPTDTDRTDRKGRRYTCGTCAHRYTNGWGFPKCDLSVESHCQQSDVRAWWPACPNYAATDGRPVE
jgi:hypothetical protein